MIKSEHLRQFLAVSNHSSLTKAAVALQRTPSAVSMTLKLIEEHLGQPLFEGDRKKTLTPLGKHVYQHSSKAVLEYDKALEKIKSFSKAKIGNVSVAAVPSVATLLLPKVMTMLCQKFPDVRVSLRDIDSGAVARTVHEEDADFGIASLSRHSQGLQTTLLTEEPFMCLLPHGHSLTESKTALNWDDISKFPFIANPLIEQITNAEISMLIDQATMRIRNISSLVAFVREGFGLTLLPRMAALLAPDLVAKPIFDQGIKRELFLLQCGDRSLSPVAEIFKESVCAALKSDNNADHHRTHRKTGAAD